MLLAISAVFISGFEQIFAWKALSCAKVSDLYK